MVWGLVIGVLLIVASIGLYRRGLRVWAVIGFALAIAALLLGYWSDSTIDDDEGSDVPVATIEGAATPVLEEGGV